jgi:hypothetical protein
MFAVRIFFNLSLFKELEGLVRGCSYNAYLNAEKCDTVSVEKIEWPTYEKLISFLAPNNAAHSAKSECAMYLCEKRIRVDMVTFQYEYFITT